jgi:CRP-like cAMP-binding protein
LSTAGTAWRFILKRFRREHRPLPAFQDALRQAGGLGSAVDRGLTTVRMERIVGSVGRWQELRSDFFYRTGRLMTQRFQRVGQALRAGKLLPPVELYKLKRNTQSEYFVLDGHHRVAMGRKLGQQFIDAHVVEYQGVDAQLAHTLRHVQILRDAPAADLVELWRHLTQEHVAAGAHLCRRGDVGDRLFIIQTGRVEVCLGTGPESVSLYQLGPGDCFGEMSLLSGAPRSADVVALEDSTLWILHRADFQRVLQQSVPLLHALNRSLVQRLSMATAVIEQTSLALSPTGAAGLRFGAYRVLAQLGAGGMSVVYSAVREGDGQTVALKVLPASWGSAIELRTRLEREAAMLQGIVHPNVIRLIDVGAVPERLGGGTYLVMEWLPDALDRFLSARYPAPLDAARALSIARGVAEALDAVHAAGLIHRDVKPSNILLRANGEPVLTDFGLVAAVNETMGQRRLTAPDAIVGTADYLAPEVISGRAVDGRADVYALGIVLFEMLVGYVPFAGREPLQVLRAHVDEPIEVPLTTPPAVRAVVSRALEKDPRDRFATAADMAAAISSVSDGQS